MIRSRELRRLLAAGVDPERARLLADAVESGALVVRGQHEAARDRGRRRAAALARVRRRQAAPPDTPSTDA